VYGAVAVAVVMAVMLLRGRALSRVIVLAVGALVGVALPLFGNAALEKATVGATLRNERATGAVTAAVTDTSSGSLPSRPREAATTALSPEPSLDNKSIAIGAALLLLLAYAAVAATRRGHGGPAAVASIGAVVLYAIRLSEGPGFVPGMFAATPIAAAGIALGWVEHRSRVLLAIAVAALPLVWAFQFRGGAAPQWAGRYILTSGFLLGVVGLVALTRMTVPMRVGFVALSLLITGFGLSWLSIRSHDVARTTAALNRLPQPVLVSRVAHLVREGGASYGEKRWLTAPQSSDLIDAARVVRAAGYDEFGEVALDTGRSSTQESVPGFRAVSTHRIRFFSGVYLRITDYRVAS
jgi:hypothetical protein